MTYIVSYFTETEHPLSSGQFLLFSATRSYEYSLMEGGELIPTRVGRECDYIPSPWEIWLCGNAEEPWTWKKLAGEFHETEKIKAELQPDDSLGIDNFKNSLLFDDMLKKKYKHYLSREIETATSKLSKKHLPVYSHLKNLLTNTATKKALGLQWTGWLSKQPGIRQHEIDASGLTSFLQHHPDTTLTRMDLLKAINLQYLVPGLYKHVSKNMKSLSVLQLVDEAPPKKVLRQFPKHWEDSIRTEYIHPAFNYRIVHIKHADLFGGVEIYPVYDNNWNLVNFKNRRTEATLQQAIGGLKQAIATRFPQSHIYQDVNPWERYSLAGGEQHQMWVLTLDNLPALFRYPVHHAISNPLLHLRTSIRRDMFGNKILFIEELQSDWFQKQYDANSEEVSRHGKPIKLPYKNNWYELGLKLALYLAAKENCQGLSWAPAEIHEMHYGGKQEGRDKFYNSILPKAAAKLAKKWQGRICDSELTINEDTAFIALKDNGYVIINEAGNIVWQAKANEKQNLDAAKVAMTELKDGLVFEIPVIYLNEQVIEQIAENGISLFGGLDIEVKEVETGVREPGVSYDVVPLRRRA